MKLSRTRLLLAILIIVLSVVGCSSVKNLPEKSKPLFMRLYSFDTQVKHTAEIEFKALEQKDKESVLLEIAGALAAEKDPDTQMRITAALDENEAGSYAAIPLLYALKKNADMVAYNSVLGIIKKMKSMDIDDTEKLKLYLKDKSWKVRSAALDIAGAMGEKAEKLVPELVTSLKEFGDDPEKYQKIFDTVAKINPEVAIYTVINSLKDASEKVKKNSVDKLLDIYTYMSKNMPYSKDVLNALMGIMYSEDETLRETVERTMTELNDAEFQEYLKSGKTFISGVMKSFGTNISSMFKSQEEKVEKKLDEFFDRIERSDQKKLINK
jgi:HEAT repeat protein